MQDPQFTRDRIDLTTNVFGGTDDSSSSLESLLNDLSTPFDLAEEGPGSRWSDSDTGVGHYEGTMAFGNGAVTQARGRDNIDDQNAVRVETTSYGDEARTPTPAHFMGDRLAWSDDVTSYGANNFQVPLNLSRDREPSVSNWLSVDDRPSLDQRPPVTGWPLLDQRPLTSNRPSFDQLLSVDSAASQDDGLSVEDRLDVGYRHLASREPSEDYMLPAENRPSVDDGLSLDYRLFGGPSMNYRPLLDNGPSVNLFGDRGPSVNDGPSVDLFGHQRPSMSDGPSLDLFGHQGPSVDDGPSVDNGLWGNHGPSVDYGHVVSSRTFVTDQEMQNELDKMFETLDEGDKTTEAEPDKAIASKLYPHQKQALNWMICQEKKETLPPFWVKRGSVYTNTLTKQRRETMPRSVCGGILADDMGLGKTLEMISLIMTNSVDGKPLAQPLPGRHRTPIRFTGKSPSKSVSTRVDSGIMDSQRTSESVHQLFTDSRSTVAANLPLSAKLILPHNQIESAENLFERSSEKCFADKVMIKKEVPEYSSFEDSDLQPTSTSGRSSVKRPAGYSFDDDKDDEWSLPSPAKRPAEYLYDGDEEDEDGEVFQPAAKNEREVTPGLLEKAIEMSLQEDRAVIFNQERAITSQTEVMSAVNTIGGIQPHCTTGNGTASLSHENSPFLPVTVADMNSCGNMRLQTVQDSTSDSYPNEIIDVDALSDSEFPIVIEDSDEEEELPDISSPPSNSSSKENIDASAEHPREHGITRDRPWADQSKGTVIICPVSVISNWVDQFEEHVDKTVHLKLHVYYGSSRSKDTDFLKQQDVIITTYLTLASDAKTLQTSPLHQIEWLRIVLDEGHNIRNPAAKQSKAIYELRAERRWVLTGTPIQNSMKDLWSLMNFLQVEPFTEKSWWNRTIARPIAKREKPALKRVAHLMGSLAMRRTKNQQLNGKPLIELPARHVYLEKITLSQEERDVYDAMQKEGKVIIGRYFRQGTLLHHYGQVLTILLRLRQLCCHPRLIASAVEKTVNGNPAGAFEDLMPQGLQSTENREMSEEDRKKLIDQLMAVLNSGSDEDCSICLDSLKNAVITPCAHIFCRACIEAVIEKEEPQPLCPLCRRVVDQNSLTEVPPETRQEETDQNDEDEEWQSSAKVDALMKALNELRQQDPRVKSVIVSQFTSLLTVLETPLGMQGFKFTRLDGTMNVNARQQALEEFADPQPGSPTIFLLSLKAGGVGINLTAASRVFLMDPAWNPAAEDQCFDRCHRLGQTKDVVITRFVIEASVEERMLEIQDKKRRLMKGAFTKKITADERRTNRINDIARLINL